MDYTRQMLQVILSGQNALKQELASKIDKLGDRLDLISDGLEVRIDKVENNLDRVERKLTYRLDKLGRQLAYLEDDTHTREEFENLEKRVERRLAL